MIKQIGNPRFVVLTAKSLVFLYWKKGYE